MDQTHTAPGAEADTQPDLGVGDRVQVREHVRGWAGYVGDVVAAGTDHVRPIRVALEDDGALDERDFEPTELLRLRRAGER